VQFILCDLEKLTIMPNIKPQAMEEAQKLLHGAIEVDQALMLEIEILRQRQSLLLGGEGRVSPELEACFNSITSRVKENAEILRKLKKTCASASC
jgi:hypothetical protein